MRFNRAFVAAPLIGTIIFLAAIVFAVNLSKTDASEVNHIVSDAYHNRIVSLLEMYRTDLGSVFAVGLSRNIESFLTRECWISEPFKITTVRSGEGDFEDKQEIAKTRYDNCVLFNKILKAVVCSLNPQYGMKSWLAKMNETSTFEGVLFEPANKASFGKFLQNGFGQSGYDSSQGTYTVASSLCETLVVGSMLDCNAFSYGEHGTPGAPERPVLQCCTVPDDENSAKGCEERGGKVRAGCSNGIFYVALKIENPEVFSGMPRISAKDGLGNEIRSGAISDKDFAIPINYPLFRYYDDAFTFYQSLALGSPGSTARGIFDGLCVQTGNSQGTNACPPGRSQRIQTGPPGDAVAAELLQLLSAAKENDQLKGTYHFSVQKSSDQSFVDSNQDLGALMKIKAGTTTTAEGGLVQYAMVKDLSLSINFNDTNSAYQVSPSKPNSFCWTANPKYQ